MNNFLILLKFIDGFSLMEIIDDLFSKHLFIARSYECTCSYQFVVARSCNSGMRLVQFWRAEKWGVGGVAVT